METGRKRVVSLLVVDGARWNSGASVYNNGQAVKNTDSCAVLTPDTLGTPQAFEFDFGNHSTPVRDSSELSGMHLAYSALAHHQVV
jgi:hypothetical protein